MLYHPRDKGMWDSWVLHHDGTFHLYYVQYIERETLWSHIGHATSPDLLRWTEQEPALLAGDEGEWDHGSLGAGTTFEADGKFYMTYCRLGSGRPQQIGIAMSDDLFRWSKHPANPILEPAMGGGIYETDIDAKYDRSPSFRDAFVWYDEEECRFHAVLAARVAQGPVARRGCVGHAVSKDLAAWKVLPPVYAPSMFHDHEVPQLHRIGDRYYLIWASFDIYTNHYQVPSRRFPAGVFYAVSESPYEGFITPVDNLLVGSGNGRWDCVVGSVMHLADESILTYHMINRDAGEYPHEVSFSAPKVLRVTEDGRLAAGYCSRVDGLRRRRLISGIRPEWLHCKRSLEGERWTVSDGVLCAEVDGSFALAAPAGAPDFMLECEVMIEGGYFAGLGMAEVGQPLNQISAGVVLDAREQQAHVLGHYRSFGKTGPVLRPLDSAGFPVRRGRFHHLRVMARQRWTDIFFDDRLMFSLALPWQEKGQFVFLACDGKMRFRNFIVHEIE